MARASALVSTKWLAECLSAPNVRILDGSWHKSKDNRDPRAEYEQEHIPGAQFFDIVGSSAKDARFKYMLPHSNEFADYVGKLGIRNKTKIVIYDNNELGLFSAPRVWWTFRVFGHNDVSIVDGGLPKWKREGRPVTDEVHEVDPQPYVAGHIHELVKIFEEMCIHIKEGKIAIADARSPGVFHAVSSEHVKDLPPGRMPNALNIHYQTLLDPVTRTLKSTHDLQTVFMDAGVDLNKPLISTCGKGITACIVALAAHECGAKDMSVYDGSWEEWYHRAPPQYKILQPTQPA